MYVNEYFGMHCCRARENDGVHFAGLVSYFTFTSLYFPQCAQIIIIILLYWDFGDIILFASVFLQNPHLNR